VINSTGKYTFGYTYGPKNIEQYSI